jgi:hypothetical protein
MYEKEYFYYEGDSTSRWYGNEKYLNEIEFTLLFVLSICIPILMSLFIWKYYGDLNSYISPIALFGIIQIIIWFFYSNNNNINELGEELSLGIAIALICIFGFVFFIFIDNSDDKTGSHTLNWSR